MTAGSESVIKGKISMIFLDQIAILNSLDSKKLKGSGKPFNFTEFALSVDVRNATITEIVRCQSLPKFSTILKCLESLELSLLIFSERFEKILDKDALDHFYKMKKLYPGRSKKNG